MDIGIIGRGTVGDAVFQGLQNIGNNLCYYDINHKNTSIESLLNTELIFVCVPTDSTPDGDCDTSIVESTIEQLHSLNYTGVIAIKSTVIPGTTDRLSNQYKNLKLCCVPEFLRQKSAYTDFLDDHDVLVIGATDSEIANVIVESHGIIPNKIVVVEPIESEIIKYFNNVHNAMEIVFANTMYEVCNKVNANYQNVLLAIQNRKNINTSYLRCSDIYRGFKGHCLPKDMLAWKNLSEKLGVEVQLFDAILHDNKRYTK